MLDEKEVVRENENVRELKEQSVLKERLIAIELEKQIKTSSKKGKEPPPDSF